MTIPWRRATGAAATLVLVTGLAGVTAARAGSPLLHLDRSTGLLNGQLVTATGTGFVPATEGVALECSAAPGQPTVPYGGQAIPVSCTAPNGPSPLFSSPFAITDGSGRVSVTVVVATGIVGPPALGMDSAGHNSAADAALFPCPPTAAQQAAGATCQISFGTAAGDSASVPIAFGTPVAARPAVSVTPATGLSDGQAVSVLASGLTPDSPFAVVECNTTPGEPTNQLIPLLPAACTPTTQLFGATVRVSDPTGAVSASFTVREGNIGAGADTAAYPCPPTLANLAAGGGCQVIVLDGANEQAATAITLTGAVPQPSLTVFPAGGLHRGSVIGVLGDHWAAASPGAILECNAAPGQPTIPIGGFPSAVGCSNPFTTGGVITTGGDGLLSGSFQIRTGTVGPIQPGTDSAGHDAAADAARFPCPPTAAQQAAGVTCQILVGDLAGDSVRVPIAFAGAGSEPSGVGLAVAHPAGWWTATPDGGVFAHGGAPFLGSLPGVHVHPGAPVVGVTATPDAAGYWLVSADGGVYAFGDAAYVGGLPQLGVRSRSPIVAMAPTVDGHGYWLVAGDGGVFAFGNAGYDGSVPALHTPAPIRVVGGAADPRGQGYWLLASDGGLLAFGAPQPG